MLVDDAEDEAPASTAQTGRESAGLGQAGAGAKTGSHRRRWLAQGDTIVTSRMDGAAAVIRVVGELDAVSAPRLWRSAHTAFKHGHDTVVVDLTSVVFLDSFGVATLLNLHQRAERRGCALRVVAADHQSARRVLSLAGADTVLALYGEVGQAVLDRRPAPMASSGGHARQVRGAP